jgi:hypothetical protein
MDPALMLSGFPTPWSVTETTREFIVKDLNGRVLAYSLICGATERHF